MNLSPPKLNCWKSRLPIPKFDRYIKYTKIGLPVQGTNEELRMRDEVKSKREEVKGKR
jgi:hypothetical protein